MNESTFLILHRKSANEPYVKEAVKSAKKSGIKLRVLVPFNKAEKPRVVAEALERGAKRIIAGGFDIGPREELDDGLLDLTAILPGPDFSLLQLSRELENPMKPDNSFVFYRQLSRFTIEADDALHCNLDGEPVSKRRLRFKCLPGHLKVAF